MVMSERILFIMPVRYGRQRAMASIKSIAQSSLAEHFEKDVYGVKRTTFSKEVVVLDIGAHIGYFELLIADHVKDVASTTEEIKFFVNSALTVLNSPARQSLSDFTQTVCAISPREVMGDRFIDMLKIDCEGGEYDIFYNSPRAVLKKIGCIVMEYHNLPDIDPTFMEANLIAFLAQNGFDAIEDMPPYDQAAATGRVFLKQKNSMQNL